MSQFEYLVTFDEWWIMLDAVLREHRLRFAIDRVYEHSRCEYHDQLTAELRKAILTSTRSVFLVGEAFSRGPLYLRQQRNGINQGKYFVDVDRGGPAIEMRMCAQFEDGDLIWFGEGAVGIQRRNWNDSLTASRPASRELKQAFAAVRATLKQHLLKKEVHGHVRWMSPEAWKLFESGKAAWAMAGKCFTVHGEVPPPSQWRRKQIVRGPEQGGKGGE